MADKDGLEGCREGYIAGIVNLNQVLIANLATAKTDEQKQAAIDKFKKGVQLCKDARQICESSFS